ncbi:uncharacterized protein LOC119902736 isoform X1 [Micropterus salmoides]|uniref:uncharacterized protein LOC119902736 isoform X1 n=1 Tax=Micropterus salmoides TaxID=27706 RepID=UPI0018ECFEC6|nr:uncharacterized protein LOC119902736 isoform X1 [Micropterus salmoides]
MSRRRCVLHCEGQPSMHRLPKDESLKNQWIKFIFNTVPQDYSPNLLLCSNHFREDCFLNRQQYNSGFAQRLVLKDDATPTLFGPGDPQPQPDAACRIFPSVRHAASQTDPPETRSVGTQLIMKAPVRSTATQATAPRRNRGVCTPTFPLDSPLLFLQPTVAKRRRLKEEQEEEEAPLERAEGGSGGAAGLDVTLSPSWLSS